MEYRRNFVRSLEQFVRSSGVIGVLPEETPVAGRSADNPSCTKGGSAVVVISIVI